jgi:hypothetical protein
MDCLTQPKWLLPRAQGNQPQEASIGGLIGPPVVEIWILCNSNDDNSWMFLAVMRWPVQTPANPSNTIVGRRRVEGVSGEG